MYDPLSLREHNVLLCKKGTPPLDDAEIAQLLAQIPQWHVDDADGVRQLVRCFEFPAAAEAVQFSTYVKAMADSVNHHPVQEVNGKTLTMRWWTHNIKGLHLNDFIMAARSDELYRTN
jgi:4a-hydroxytetrahydrobiopterin dehydratase